MVRGKLWMALMKWQVKRKTRANRSQVRPLPMVLIAVLALVLGFGIALGKDVLMGGIKEVSAWTWPIVLANPGLALEEIGLLAAFGFAGLMAVILFNACVKVLSAEIERNFIQRK